MKKNEMIESLKLKEAKFWESYQENYKVLYEKHGSAVQVLSEISETEIREEQRLISRWHCIHTILEDLDILPYTYLQRDELKKQGKL